MTGLWEVALFKVDTPDGLMELVGQSAGPSSWIEVTQQRIDAFAHATDDLQWIHLDAARTKAEFGHPPIAHGYLTLSLLAPAMYELLQIRRVGQMINYGINKVRFIAPVLAGDRIRATMSITSAEREAGFVRAIHDVTVNSDRLDKPVMIAQLIVLYFDAPDEVENG
jgi:acyl dehydratase